MAKPASTNTSTCYLLKILSSFNRTITVFCFISEILDCNRNFFPAYPKFICDVLNSSPFSLTEQIRSETMILDFNIRLFADTSRTGLFTSLIVWTFSEQNIRIASNSTMKISRDSVSRLLPWDSSWPASMAQTEHICLSQIPPKVGSTWWILFLNDEFCTCQCQNVLYFALAHF